jgi:hypothetical protein
MPFEYDFDRFGYVEMARRDEARRVIIQIAVAIAMLNGPLGDRQSKVIDAWADNSLTRTGFDHRPAIRAALDKAKNEARRNLQIGKLSLHDLIEPLREVSDDVTAYEAIELCFDVIAAGGAADSYSVQMTEVVANALGYDGPQFAKMRDAKFAASSAPPRTGT